jgi:hypothetical protein
MTPGLTRRGFVVLAAGASVGTANASTEQIHSTDQHAGSTESGYGVGGYGLERYGNITDSPSIYNYTDEGGTVDRGGFYDAVEDWQDGEIGSDLLLEAYAAWRGSSPSG